jgi:hypothetical protein
MTERTTLSTLAEHVGRAFARLADVVSSPVAFQGVMLELGWRCEVVPTPLAALAAPARSLGDVLGDGALSVDEVPAALQAIQELAAAISDLENQSASMPPILVDEGFAEQISRQLIDYLLIGYLDDEFPLAISLLTAMGLARETDLDDEGNRPGSIQHTIAWEDAPALLSNPRQLFVNAYGWARDDFDAGVLFEPLLDLGDSLGLSLALNDLPEQFIEPLGYEADADPSMLELTVVENRAGAAGVQFCALPATGTRPPGVAILPFVTGPLPDPIVLTDELTLSVQTDLDAASLAVLLRPDTPIEIRSPVSSIPAASGEIRAELTYTGGTGERILLLGSSEGSRLQAAAVSVTAGATTGANRDLFIEFRLAGGQLIIDGGESSSFLGALLGDASRTIDLSPAVGWSTERGAFMPGGAALGVTLPFNLTIGPITINDVLIEIVPDGDRIDIDLGAALAATVGPFGVVTDTIGVTGGFRFLGSGGNLGPIDADVRFLPPTILVFGLETEAISGGGLIQIDPESGRYSGGLALDIFGLGISAIVVIDTEVPGGQGWALFASIGVVFPTPVPIGFGFTLIGVGGLIAVHRTMDVNALASGLKTGAADAVLFPDDFLSNATTILNDLDQWFPIQAGTTTFGPVAAIGWGTPTLITAQLGIALALPDLIVALLGSVEVMLPAEDEAVLAFRMDILGAVDVPASEVIVAASLYDSHLLQVFELSGDMGFYARLSGQPLFLLSIGGYHPQFDPPGALPSWILDLRRTQASVPLGDAVRVTLSSYVALTSNTVQFGGRFELIASVKVLLTTYTAEGWFTINLLLVLKPLKFLARATAGVSVSAGDRELFGVQLTARLEGPQPWYATGTAVFNFFGLDVDFGFEIGGQPGGAPRELHDVGTDVVTALQADGVWTAVSGDDLWSAGVVMTEALPAGLWVRPDQLVEIRQNVAPLNRTITAFGEYVPQADRIVADQVTLGGEAVPEPDWIEDWFAPAQFDRLEQGDSLSAPSYEMMTAGVRFGDEGVSLSADVDEECTSVSREPEESIFPDRQRRRSPFVSPVRDVRTGADTRTVKGPNLSLQTTSYTVIKTVDGTRAGAALAEAGGGTKLTYVDAVRVIAARAADNPLERSRLRVVPYAASGA